MWSSGPASFHSYAAWARARRERGRGGVGGGGGGEGGGGGGGLAGVLGGLPRRGALGERLLDAGAPARGERQVDVADAPVARVELLHHDSSHRPVEEAAAELEVLVRARGDWEAHGGDDLVRLQRGREEVDEERRGGMRALARHD